MSTPSANGDTITQTAVETVTATVTRTITTTDAEGQTTTLYTTTDEKIAKLGGDADGTNPVAVSNIKHTEQVSTTTGVDDLTTNLFAAIEQSNGAAGADSDIMRMLSGMLQAGLQSKGPPAKHVAAKVSQNAATRDPMAAARGTGSSTHAAGSNPAPRSNNSTQPNTTNNAGNNPPAQANSNSARR